MDIQTSQPKVTFVDREGDCLTVCAEVGSSVMQTAKCNGIPGIRADCGGYMQCGTCHVYVDDAQLDMVEPMSPLEDDMLYGVAAERRPNSRLSCQLSCRAGLELRVTLPDRQV